jgi:hypothetical protein
LIFHPLSGRGGVFEWNAALAEIVEAHHSRRGLRGLMGRVVADAPEPSGEVVSLRPRRSAPHWLSMTLATSVAVGLWIGIIVGVLALPRH